MTFDHVRLDRQGAALRITLDRPRVLNALSPELLDELHQALEGPAADEGVRAVLLTGAGKGFCAGADLTRMPIDGNVAALVERSYNPIVRRLFELPKPVVAGVNGVAAGAGMSLALACDLRLLSSAASFVAGFTGRGLTLDASCSYTLPRLVGLGRAFEMVYSGRSVAAEEALALGLGERVLAAESFDEEAWSFVRALADGPTYAFALAKQELHASFHNDFDTQLALEAELQGHAATSDDVREGIAAFREKRAPRFQGR